MTRPPISHSIVFTYTDDLERGSRFFREVLELDFVVDQGTSGVTLTIVSPDVDGWRDFLEAKGVEYVSGPAHSAEFGVYSSLFHSPDGYRVEIQGFDDPDWDTRIVPV